MTIEQWNNELREKRDVFNTENAPVFIAASDTLAKMSERIFFNGLNVAGQTHQYNSTTPIYLNTQKNRVSTPKGKPGANRNIKDRKTAYFPSYKAYRESVGLIAKRVVYENIGDLRSDFENLNAPGEGGPRVRKVIGKKWAVAVKIIRPVNVKKSERLDKKYGLTFAITASEKQNYIDVAKEEFTKLIKRGFR